MRRLIFTRDKKQEERTSLQKVTYLLNRAASVGC
uniref:Uncharacterized protein n=1 Tax=Anguilla anguilla TaxID=7936 RepID=A0A0E9RFF3_ANGAN